MFTQLSVLSTHFNNIDAEIFLLLHVAIFSNNFNTTDLAKS